MLADKQQVKTGSWTRVIALGTFVALGMVPGLFGQNVTWTNATDMPWAVGELSSGMLQGARGEPLLVVVGFDQRNRTAQAVTMVLDVRGGNWSRRADRPFRGHHMAAATVGNRLYLIGGFLNNSTFNMQIYNPLNDSWTVGPPPPFGSGGGCAAAINSSIYYCGGVLNGLLVNSPPTRACAVFHVPAGTWSNVTSLPQAVHHCSAGSDGRRLFVIGGRNSAGNNGLRPVDFNQVYDTANKSWVISTQRGGPAALPVGRGGMGPAIYMDGKLYVTGGEIECNNLTALYTCPNATIGFTAQGVFNRVDRYDPVANKWDLGLGWMAAPRHGHYPVLGPDPSGGRQVAWVCGGALKVNYDATRLCQYMSLGAH